MIGTVICDFCNWTGTVNIDSDQCPHCQENGHLIPENEYCPDNDMNQQNMQAIYGIVSEINQDAQQNIK